MEAIYLGRILMGRYRMKRRDLHLFIERLMLGCQEGVLWKALEKKLLIFETSRICIRVLKPLCKHMVAGGAIEGFPITIGLHQGSTLSPYIFTLVLDVLTQ